VATVFVWLWCAARQRKSHRRPKCPRSALSEDRSDRYLPGWSSKLDRHKPYSIGLTLDGVAKMRDAAAISLRS
jgi:hypothetical protein